MRTLILLFIYGLLAILLIPVLLFCYLVRYSQPLILIGKWVIRLGQKIVGIRLEISGVENIDKKASYVFMANHLSIIDGPILFMIIPQSVRVILKKEIFRIPIVAQAMRQIGFIPVDRKRLKGGKESIDRASRHIKEKGFSFLIFPEGTRSRDGKLQPFKRGGFFLALASLAPIVPVSLKGSYELMPRGSFFVKKGIVRANFHRAVPVEGFDRSSLPQLIDKVKKIIQSGLED
ncbi:MAG: 1-acyl-sn-glycerol-3-phosphate acyltransferase [Candidatus Aminicenantes bacterium]|nr:MAG: 1-acyl-sn-glycerol-3-phosphate acyltransferase [Candidatus Aminicenantes bacterium]